MSFPVVLKSLFLSFFGNAARAMVLARLVWSRVLRLSIIFFANFFGARNITALPVLLNIPERPDVAESSELNEQYSESSSFESFSALEFASESYSESSLGFRKLLWLMSLTHNV